jgi:hypothetical protein
MKIIIALFLLVPFITQASTSLIYDAQKKGINLTEKDKDILEVGEISTARYVTGGILGTYPIGFGLGHAIQGRWSQNGWIFTAGESASLALLLGGALGCVNNTVFGEDCSDLENAIMTVGVIGFVGLRLWEIVDVWAAPPSHNSKYRELRDYINTTPVSAPKATLDLVPIVNPRLGQGLALNLKF